MIQVFLTIGVVSLIISGIFIGAWTDGERQRANSQQETEQHRKFRTNVSLYFGIVGIASLGIAGICYFI
ncbi:DUF5316 family protein [Cytobacillus sp.]|uniref:DUF5316 family protein n=1 Tax=Cytobacillus sp. TaxID=2675269 RepID=UPI0028BD2E9D|nr:DUF5316 family protein [Cytobacillus sp.]